MKCPNCGNLINDNAAFCRYCGAKLDGGIRPNGNGGGSQNGGVGRDKKESFLNKHMLTIIISVTCAVVVCGVIVAVVLLAKKGNKNNDMFVVPEGATTQYEIVSGESSPGNNENANDGDINVDHADNPNQTYIDDILSQVSNLMEKKDYDSALKKLNEAKSSLMDSDSDQESINKIENKIQEVNSEYAAMYAEMAKEAFANRNAEGAIGNINAALELQPNNSDYLAAKTEYEKYIPFALFIDDNCLQDYRWENGSGFYFYSNYDTHSEVANDNTERFKIIEWYGINPDEYSFATYHLGGNYDYVTGTEFVLQENKSKNYIGYIEAFCDGNLIYTSPRLTAGVLPQDIRFDVTGCQRLEIRFHADGPRGADHGSVCFGVSELQAYKKYPGMN